MRTNGVEELVDINHGLFTCLTFTGVRLLLELTDDLELQLSITAPSAVIGIPHSMTRNRPTLLAFPSLLEILQTLLGLLDDLGDDVDPVLQPRGARDF